MKYLKFFLCGIFVGVCFIAASDNSLNMLPANLNVKWSGTACPVINTENIILGIPDCNKSNGSITGVLVTSSGSKITYIWRDGNRKQVGNKPDLLNVPAGHYTLEVNDNSGCNTPVFSNPIFLDVKGVTIDITGVKITKAGCTSDGSITGLKVTNATLFEWHSFLTGQVITTASSNLIGVPAGSYALVASNNSGCSAESPVITVQSIIQVPGVAQVRIVNPACGMLDDTVAITLTVQKGSPQLRFYFESENGGIISNGYIFSDNILPTIRLSGQPAGVYKLFVYNEKALDCPVLIGSYTLKPAIIVISLEQTKVYNDKCNEHNGAIAPVITGIVTPASVFYTWKDSVTGKIVSTAKDLFLAGAGTYTLYVVSKSNPDCNAFASFTINNTSPTLIAPEASGSIICLPGAVAIQVNNLVTDTAGTYKLYAALNDSIPLASTPLGLFYQSIQTTTDFYLAYKQNDCESPRTKVTEVVLANVNIPNAFTPNNDGINDNWGIKGLDAFPGSLIEIFNRSGKEVFHSINYSTPFDGRYNGKQLPVGVYYFIIDLHQPVCFGKISGSLTIIR